VSGYAKAPNDRKLEQFELCVVNSKLKAFQFRGDFNAFAPVQDPTGIIFPATEFAFTFLAQQTLANSFLGGGRVLPGHCGENIEAVFVVIQLHLFIKELRNNVRIAQIGLLRAKAAFPFTTHHFAILLGHRFACALHFKLFMYCFSPGISEVLWTNDALSCLT
jgi:hypothetical protein